MDYGTAIKKIREMKNIPRKRLATEVGVASSYIAHIETGKRIPSVPMLEDIARALEIPLPLMLLAGAENDDLCGISGETAEEFVRLGNALIEAFRGAPDE